METEDLQACLEKLLMVDDGFNCDIQLSVLDIFERNFILDIALPSHTSHLLEPLDVCL